jgi:hypothetical protein
MTTPALATALSETLAAAEAAVVTMTTPALATALSETLAATEAAVVMMTTPALAAALSETLAAAEAMLASAAPCAGAAVRTILGEALSTKFVMVTMLTGRAGLRPLTGSRRLLPRLWSVLRDLPRWPLPRSTLAEALSRRDAERMVEARLRPGAGRGRVGIARGRRCILRELPALDPVGSLRREKILALEFTRTAAIELLQDLRRIFDFLLVDHTVVIGVEGVEDRLRDDYLGAWPAAKNKASPWVGRWAGLARWWWWFWRGSFLSADPRRGKRHGDRRREDDCPIVHKHDQVLGWCRTRRRSVFKRRRWKLLCGKVGRQN